MLMKTFALIAALFTLSFICTAQVYTYKPKYFVQIIYSSDLKSSPYFEKVAERPNAVVVIDLDKKTISVPGNVFPEPMLKDIEEIIPNKDDNSIMLKMKASRDVGQVWSFFKLKLDSEGKPSYLLLTERLTGKRFARDTFFNLFTNDLTTLFFVMKCSSGKRYTVTKGDKAAMEAEHKAFLAAEFKEEEHTVEMRDGYVYWKEGPGKKAVRHMLTVSGVEKLNVSGGEGVKILCSEPGGNDYEFYYSYASTAHQHFISIYRKKGGTVAEIMLIK